MIPRTAPLPVPTSSRYRVVEHAKGLHHLRTPAFAPASRVLGFVGRERDRCAAYLDDGAPTPRWLMEMSAAFCAAIGATWWHRAMALEAVAPMSAGATDDEWRAYGEAVADELVEAGYSALDADVLPLYNVAAELIQAGCALLIQAQAKSVFTEAQTETSTPAS